MSNIVSYGRPKSPSKNTSIECIVDSGCTKHYVQTHPMLEKIPSPHNIDVMLPNGSLMSSSGATNLNIPGSTTHGQKAHIFNELQSGNLLSVGQLCDDGYEIKFTKDQVHFCKNKSTCFAGQRNKINGMWMTKFPHQANIILPYKPLGDAIRFMHAACFSPCLSTWCKAIDAGYFSSWHGLTSKRVRQFIKHIPEATTKGHLVQEKQNLRSTNSFMANNLKPIYKEAYVKIELAKPTPTLNKNIYSDLTGRFPQRSTRGNQYIFVLYDTNSNCIFAEPIKDRTSTHIEKAYEKIINILQQANIYPLIHVLDNEASKTYSTLIQKHGKTKIQFVPPHVHRRNVAERSIRTFKAHFISGLCSTHRDFPLNLWDRLIPQAQMTLNMMRPSNINANISAHEQIFGSFNLDSTPFAPPGIKAIIHLKPNQRPTFGPRGLTCWYIGPSKQHYRCMAFYNPNGGARISDTAMLYPHLNKTPEWTQANALIQAANDLTNAIRKPHNDSPYNKLLKEQQIALQRLAEIFELPTSLNKEYGKVPRVDHPNSHHPMPGQPRVNATQYVAASDPIPAFPRQPNTHHQPPAQPPLAPLPPTPRLPTLVRRRNQHLPQRTTRHQKTIHMGNFMREIYIKEKYSMQHTYNVPSHLCNAIIDPKSGKSLEFRHLIQNPATQKIWNKSFANELGRLADGVSDRVKGTNTIKFIPKSLVPKGRKVTYGRIVVDFRPSQ